MLIKKNKNQNKTKFISKSIVWNYCVETERKNKKTNWKWNRKARTTSKVRAQRDAIYPVTLSIKTNSILHNQAAVDIATKLDRNSDSEFVPIKVKSLTNVIRKIQVSVIDPLKFPQIPTTTFQ